MFPVDLGDIIIGVVRVTMKTRKPEANQNLFY